MKTNFQIWLQGFDALMRCIDLVYYVSKEENITIFSDRKKGNCSSCKNPSRRFLRASRLGCLSTALSETAFTLSQFFIFILYF